MITFLRKEANQAVNPLEETQGGNKAQGGRKPTLRQKPGGAVCCTAGVLKN